LWLELWPAGAAFVTCLIAQDLKEQISPLVGRWPRCQVQSEHELYVDPDLGADPHWVCEQCGLDAGRIGEL
jgi:hypothetical protein